MQPPPTITVLPASQSDRCDSICPVPAQSPPSGSLCLPGQEVDKTLAEQTDQSDLWDANRQPSRISSSLRKKTPSHKGTSQFAIAATTHAQLMEKQAKLLPPNSARAKAIVLVQSRNFTFIVAGAIAINVIFLGIETDLKDPEDNALGVWYYLEVFFTVGFCVELVLRLFADRCLYFKDRWNIFDLLLVVLSCIDNFIVEHIALGNNQGGQAVEIVAVMRILRVARVARIIRLLRFFKKLWLLIIGVVHAMRTLVWALVLITIVIFVFGMFMARALGLEHAGEDESIDDQFGNVPKSMFTLFQVMTLEGWPDIVRNAMTLEPWIWPVFFIFLMMTTFSIMNVIVAVIVESTLEQADDHKSDSMKRHEAELKEAGEKITKIFSMSDADGDGEITKEEFMDALKRKDILAYLEDVGIDVRQAEDLFEILDYDDSGSLDAKEFTSGVLKARGGALAKDILAVQCELWRYEGQLRREIQNLCRGIDRRVTQVNSEIDGIHSDLESLRCSLGLTAPEADPVNSGTDFTEAFSEDEAQYELTCQGEEMSLDSSISLQELAEDDVGRSMTKTMSSMSMKRVRAPL